MTKLKDKSDHNLKASGNLLTKSLCAPSVHCSYYSCIQLMLHILRSDLKKSDLEVDKESEAGSKNEGGFHNWLINLILRELVKKDFQLSRDFSTFVGQLKGLRVKADYKNVEISPNKAKEGLEFAQHVIEILQQKFKI
jgi:hypothetical protein